MRRLGNDDQDPKVIALTLNWNGGLHTLECLKSLQESLKVFKSRLKSLRVLQSLQASLDDSLGVFKSL